VNSPCIDAGTDAGVYDDIDDDIRPYDYPGIDNNGGLDDFDIGADECDCNDVSNAVDWNCDGVVDYYELAVFSDAWLTEPNDANDPNSPDWNPDCDLDGDDFVDFNDFAVFANEWRWQACYMIPDTWMMMSMGGAGFAEMAVTLAEPIVQIPFSQAEITQFDAAKLVSNYHIRQQIAQTEEIIEFFENLWQTDKEFREMIDENDWLEFINTLYDWLDELQDSF